MTITANCPSLAGMMVNHQQITHRRHQHGWLELPDGRHFQPKVTDVQFVPGMCKPFMSRPRPRWFARLMGIFA
ncbi:phage filamentation protein Fil family protein [Serratia quinivorans]|uniref:Phage filamentation protein Fil family protein n=1 Tax=Serratia quinivorans TaxID=137545 RepID=A0ABV3UDD6_9GAMM